MTAAWKAGDRVRRANGVVGTVVKVCNARTRWTHPFDHCEMSWSDGTGEPMSMMGLRRLARLPPAPSEETDR